MERFVVATVGGLHQQPTSVARLRKDIDPFAAAPWCVLHPNDGNFRTFALQGIEGGSFGVASHACLGFFDSPDKNNLLYFENPPTAGSIVLLNDHGEYLSGSPLWYTRVVDEEFSMPSSWLNSISPTGRNFYRQTENRPKGSFQTVAICVLPDLKEPDAWMNPVLLNLALDGNEAGLDDPQFHPFTTTENAIIMEPGWDTNDDVRFAFWKMLAADRAQHGRAPSLIETLFVGPQAQESQVRALQALDVLDGVFQIDCHTSPASYKWCPPGGGLSPNAKQYADFWLKIWHGNQIESPSTDGFSDRLDASDSSPGQLTHRIPIAPHKWAANVDSAIQLLNFAFGKMELTTPAGLVASLLQRPELREGPAAHCHRGHYRFDDQDGQRTLEIDLVTLLDRFMCEHVLPRSRVWITLPSDPAFTCSQPGAAQAAAREVRKAFHGRFFDLKTSLTLGGYETLRRLSSRFGRFETAQTTPTAYVYDWLSDWFNWIYEAQPSDVFTLRVPESGFVVGRSPLGVTPLGWSGKVERQPRHVRL